MQTMKQLLIGCGRNKQKKVSLQKDGPDWDELITLDINPAVNPDIVWDLNKLPYPFDDDTFDEIHAYEVLEHLGALGDYKSFLAQFQELWRILKPNGVLIGSAPALESPWLFGDPGHTRVISLETLTYLSQSAYGQIDRGSPMTDYRDIYKGNLTLVGHRVEKVVGLKGVEESSAAIFIFILQALK